MPYILDNNRLDSYGITTHASDTATKLLLHCDGTNTSTAFVDEIGKTVIAGGDAKLSTVNYKFGVSSAQFDGSGDYLSVPDSNDFYFGTGDFTLDFWISFSTYSSTGRYCLFSQNSDTYSNYFICEIVNGRLALSCLVGGATTVGYYSTPLSWSIGVWYHIAIVRSGNSLKLYINGIAATIDTTYFHTAFNGGSFGNYTGAFYIGQWNSGRYFAGYIDEFRISKGLALWTVNFTPPDQPLYYYKNYWLADEA